MEKLVRDIIESVVAGKIGVDEAVSSLLNEMGRGGVFLVVDEHYLKLRGFLSDKNYTVDYVLPGTRDEQVKKQLTSRIFITHNGKHFSDPEDMEKYYYGLIWVTTNEDEQILAKKIEKVLMTHNFKRDLVQMVKIER